MFFSSVAYAQTAAPQGSPSIIEGLIPFILLFAIFYFLIILPNKKRAKQHQKFLSELKKGDSVLTSSGILGTIEGLTDKYVTLEIAEGVKIRILRSQIASISKEG